MNDCQESNDDWTSQQTTGRRSVLKRIGVGTSIVTVGGTGSVVAAPDPSVGAITDDELVVVPLDDRPANIYFPEMSAAAAGLETVFPPEDTIGYFETPGDGGAIGDWLLSRDQVDGFVISADMLAYGGLIASRTPGKSKAEAQTNVEILAELRADHPDTPIFVYDTIQRLAPTELGEDDFDPSLVEEWAILVDRVENLGHEEYEDELAAVEAQIPVEILVEYTAARERNHSVNQYLIELAAEGTIDQLVLSQDDAAEYGLHRAEREELLDLVSDLGVEDSVEVFPGADEVDATFIARYVQQALETTARVSISYAGREGSEWIAPLEDISFEENIIKHLEVSGATVVEEDADIALMVNTPSDDSADRQAELDDFVSQITALQDAGQHVMVVDPIYTNQADPELMDCLETNADVTDLLSYSGWNTAGNALGIATGHGLARWSFLQRSDRGVGVPELIDPAEAHVNYLLHRLTLDNHWKNVVQPDAYDKGWSIGANIWDLEPDDEAVLEAFVQDELEPFISEYYRDHFDGITVELGVRGNQVVKGRIDGLENVTIELPWPRLFETKLEPDVDIQWPN